MGRMLAVLIQTQSDRRYPKVSRLNGRIGRRLLPLEAQFVALGPWNHGRKAAIRFDTVGYQPLHVISEYHSPRDVLYELNRRTSDTTP